MDSHVLCWSTRVYHLGMLRRTVGRILENPGVIAIGLLALPRLLKVCRLLLHEWDAPELVTWDLLWISDACSTTKTPLKFTKKKPTATFSTTRKPLVAMAQGVHQRDRFEEVVVFFQGMPVEENSGGQRWIPRPLDEELSNGSSIRFCRVIQ